MNLHFKGICLLLLASSQLGFAGEHANEPLQANEAVASSAGQALQREEMGPSLGSDDLAAMGGDVDGPILVAEVRRNTSASDVMDQMELGRTEITGNQELPTVMYIVPWQKSDLGELMGRPVNTLPDEVLAPIDRSEFIRQVDYFGNLNNTDEE